MSAVNASTAPATNSQQLARIAGFIWGIADDILRDLYVRGKYRDVILPMTVLRRFDAVLEPTKQAVLEMKAFLDKQGIVDQNGPLRDAAGQAVYNRSKFTLRELRSRTSQQQLRLDFEAYLDGFSPNVQEILDAFEFRNQIPRLSKADAIGSLIEKFLDPSINLSPQPVLNGDGSVKFSGLDNHGTRTRAVVFSVSRDGGEDWSVRSVRTLASCPLSGYFAGLWPASVVDARVWWIVAGRSRPLVQVTSDAGRHWPTVVARGLPTRPCSVISVSAASRKVAWVVARDQGSNSALFQTRNGGRSWHRLSLLRG